MTAVEYIQQEFLKKLTDENYNISFDEIIEKAKELEKEQIIDANIAGMEFIPVDPNKYQQDAEQYYNETYNK